MKDRENRCEKHFGYSRGYLGFKVPKNAIFRREFTRSSTVFMAMRYERSLSNVMSADCDDCKPMGYWTDFKDFFEPLIWKLAKCLTNMSLTNLIPPRITNAWAHSAIHNCRELDNMLPHAYDIAKCPPKFVVPTELCMSLLYLQKMVYISPFSISLVFDDSGQSILPFALSGLCTYSFGNKSVVDLEKPDVFSKLTIIKSLMFRRDLFDDMCDSSSGVRQLYRAYDQTMQEETRCDDPSERHLTNMFIFNMCLSIQKKKLQAIASAHGDIVGESLSIDCDDEESADEFRYICKEASAAPTLFFFNVQSSSSENDSRAIKHASLLAASAKIGDVIGIDSGSPLFKIIHSESWKKDFCKRFGRYSKDVSRCKLNFDPILKINLWNCSDLQSSAADSFVFVIVKLVAEKDVYEKLHANYTGLFTGNVSTEYYEGSEGVHCDTLYPHVSMDCGDVENTCNTYQERYIEVLRACPGKTFFSFNRGFYGTQPERVSFGDIFVKPFGTNIKRVYEDSYNTSYYNSNPEIHWTDFANENFIVDKFRSTRKTLIAGKEKKRKKKAICDNDKVCSSLSLHSSPTVDMTSTKTKKRKASAPGSGCTTAPSRKKKKKLKRKSETTSLEHGPVTVIYRRKQTSLSLCLGGK